MELDYNHAQRRYEDFLQNGKKLTYSSAAFFACLLGEATKQNLSDILSKKEDQKYFNDQYYNKDKTRLPKLIIGKITQNIIENDAAEGTLLTEVSQWVSMTPEKTKQMIMDLNEAVEKPKKVKGPSFRKTFENFFLILVGRKKGDAAEVCMNAVVELKKRSKKPSPQPVH